MEIMSRQLDILTVAQMGYSFGDLIGKGCYGKVFKAQYHDSNKQNDPVDLACKYIIKKKCPNDFLEKFLPREIEILKEISHPHIIRTHSIIRSTTSIFIFMRLEQQDLLSFVKERGVVKETVGKIWFHQLACAINYLHSKNIAHRDLKCENILISKNLNLKIADFGFARRQETNDFLSAGLCIFSKTYCGSAAYAPPEVVSGTPYDIMKVDIWSLGIVLMIMLNGMMPFDDTRISRLIFNQRKRILNFDHGIMKSLSHECQSTIYMCLEPDPIKRLTSYELLQTSWLKSMKQI